MALKIEVLITFIKLCEPRHLLIVEHFHKLQSRVAVVVYYFEQLD